MSAPATPRRSRTITAQICKHVMEDVLNFIPDDDIMQVFNKLKIKDIEEVLMHDKEGLQSLEAKVEGEMTKLTVSECHKVIALSGYLEYKESIGE